MKSIKTVERTPIGVRSCLGQAVFRQSRERGVLRGALETVNVPEDIQLPIFFANCP